MDVRMMGRLQTPRKLPAEGHHYHGVMLVGGAMDRGKVCLSKVGYAVRKLIVLGRPVVETVWEEEDQSRMLLLEWEVQSPNLGDEAAVQTLLGM
jgi:hypothetical protein